LEKLDLDASPDLQVSSKDFSWMAENHKTMAENLETKYAHDLGHQAGVWGEQTLSTYSLDIQKMKRMQLRTYKKRQGATDMCYFGDKSRTKATLQLVMDPLRKQIEAFTMGLEASTSNILEKFPTIMEQDHETTQHKLVAFETTFNKITSMTQCFEFYKWLMEWKEDGVFEKLRNLIKVEKDNQGNSLAHSESLSSQITETIAKQEEEVKKLAKDISSILSELGGLDDKKGKLMTELNEMGLSLQKLREKLKTLEESRTKIQQEMEGLKNVVILLQAAGQHELYQALHSSRHKISKRTLQTMFLEKDAHKLTQIVKESLAQI